MKNNELLKHLIDSDYRPMTGSNYGMSIREIFESKIKIVSSECWEWQGKRYSNGYGSFCCVGQMFLAHRASYQLFNGDLDHRLVCHNCDNPRCVNPKHLFLGTAHDNAQDRLTKGRCNPARGSQAGKSKLTEQDVIEIRRLQSDGMFHEHIASKFGVSIPQITRIVNRQQWRHV